MKFTLEKKMVVQVRYYEYMYTIRDDRGERIYAGTDEATAKKIQAVLNGYAVKRKYRKRKVKRK